MVTISEAVFPQDEKVIRALFGEFAKDVGLAVESPEFAAEMASLPGVYAGPRGRVLIAREGAVAAGCAALRPFGEDACELARLYVRAMFRGRGAGRMLVARQVELAGELGYRRVLLEATATMSPVVSRLRGVGFAAVPPYRDPIAPGSVFMELCLPARS